MQRHFNFSDEQMAELKKQNITEAQLFKFARDFDPTGKMNEIGLINLLTYIDIKGDFTEKPFFKTKIICNAVFDNLGIVDKIQVHEYIGDKEDGLF